MGKPEAGARLWLEPWSSSDLPLLQRANAPELMDHLGGPETDEQLITRHQRYLDLWASGEARMFRVVVAERPEGLGTVGYWDRVWEGRPVLEAGWGIESEFHGRGLATLAVVAALDHARRHSPRREVHAFPQADHAASNAVCRKAGFSIIGPCDFEYPPGHPIVSNDWRIDLGVSSRP